MWIFPENIQTRNSMEHSIRQEMTTTTTEKKVYMWYWYENMNCHRLLYEQTWCFLSSVFIIIKYFTNQCFRCFTFKYLYSFILALLTIEIHRSLFIVHNFFLFFFHYFFSSMCSFLSSLFNRTDLNFNDCSKYFCHWNQPEELTNFSTSHLHHQNVRYHFFFCWSIPHLSLSLEVKWQWHYRASFGLRMANTWKVTSWKNSTEYLPLSFQFIFNWISILNWSWSGTSILPQLAIELEYAISIRQISLQIFS